MGDELVMPFFKNKLLTLLSVDQNRLSVLQGNNVKLDFFASGLMDWADEKKAAALLATLLPAIQRRQISESCLVLPRIMFFSKLISLPTIDEQEIRKMVSLQISQYLPYPPEQAVWDFIICGHRGSASDVMILSVQMEALMKYLRVLALQGIFPSVITLSSACLFSLLSALSSKSHQVIFYLQENSTEICFSMEGKYYFSRAIAYGSKDLEGDNLSSFLAQVRKTFEVQRKSFSQYTVLQGLYLTRSPQNLSEEFLEKLSKESGIAWSELTLDEFKKSSGAFSFPHQQDLSVDTVLNLPLLRSGFKNVGNFLPQNLKEKYNVKISRRKTIAFIFLVIGSILSLTFAVAAPCLKKAQQVKLLEKELKSIENPFLKLRQEKELQAVIKKGLDANTSPLAIIEELYRALPSGVSLSSIRLSEKNELALEGQALQSSLVNDLSDKMNAIPLFEEVQLEHTLRRLSVVGEVFQFDIKAKIRKKSPAKG